jgi:DoxX-like protein
MESKPSASPNALFWIGWIVSALPALFLLFGGIMSLVKPPAAGEGLAKYGYAESVAVPLGAVLLISTLLYLFPRTAVLGGILLTGYLGGAVATHVRAGEGAFFILFPVVFGVVIWLGLVLREPRLRSLVPWRN